MSSVKKKGKRCCKCESDFTIDFSLLGKVIDDVVSLLERKNSDYGNSYFKLRNEFGKVAFVVRIADKVERLKVLLRQLPRVDESEEETITDIIGYCLLELLYRYSLYGSGRRS